MSLSSRSAELIKCLQEAGIMLIEWENSLLNRLGCDLMVHGDLVFIIPDCQMHKACDVLAGLGISLADETLAPAFTSEYSNVAIRYILDTASQNRVATTPCRLVLLPFSWTGIDLDDIEPIPDHSEPGVISTVSLSTACTAFVRIAAREKHGSWLRVLILRDLGSLMASALFDTSYERDFMQPVPDDRPWTEKEVLELKDAVQKIDGWAFKEGEEWIREKLIDAVTGEINYYGACWDKPE